MITFREIAYRLYGAWRLACFDPDGLDRFDNTVPAFWRSFWAAVVVLPGMAVLESLRYDWSKFGDGLNIAVAIIGMSLFYVIGWLIYPLAMFYVTGFIGKDDRYLRYISAYNWAGVLPVALYVTIVLIVHYSGASPEAAAPLFLFATVAVLIYAWFIVRTALGIGTMSAIGFVIFEFFIGQMLTRIENAMIYVPSA